MIMGRALFFLGRGRDARLLGSLYRSTPAEHTNAIPTPQALAALPIGCTMLTASDPDTYATAAADLITGWHTGGFGAAYTADEEQLPSDTCPDPDGVPTATAVTKAPATPSYQVAYAYDAGQVWWWHEDSWHTITVTTPTHPDTDGAGRPTVAVAPAMRRYGASYPDTADLDLPQLAVWIMSELVACAHDPDTGLSPHVRYAAKVNPRCATIRFTAFGLRDDQRFEFPDAPAEQVIAHHAEPIIHAHNWSTPRHLQRPPVHL